MGDDFSFLTINYLILPSKDADKWIQMINRRLRAETPGGVTEEEVTSYLKEQVASKYHHLAKAFSEIDYARIGVVTRDDFRNLLNNQNIRVNDEQVK